MGLKKDNYTIEALGLEIPNAYAKVSKVTIEAGGKCTATFNIQKDRNHADLWQPFEQIEQVFIADRTGNLFEQAYEYAKTTEQFTDWEDDIVAEEGGTDNVKLKLSNSKSTGASD